MEVEVKDVSAAHHGGAHATTRADDVRKVGRSPLFAWVVLVLGIACALLAWHRAAEREHAEAVARFRIDASAVRDFIQRRLSRQLGLLDNLSGLFAAQGEVSRLAFHRYLRTIDFERAYPGVLGAQFAPLVRHEQKSAFEARVRADRSLVAQGYPDFAISPAGDRPAYLPVEYNEPMAPNAASFGYDQMFEPKRREATERARDAGEARASRPILLIQDKPARPGLVVRMPVYRQGAVTDGVPARRAAYIGQLSAVFRIEDLMRSALPANLGTDIELQLVDRGWASDTLALVSTADDLIYRRPASPRADAVEEIHVADVLEVAGRRWELQQTRALPAFHWGRQALSTLLIGLLLATLASAIVRSLLLQRSRALSLAHGAMARLRESNDRLRESEQALARAHTMANLGGWTADLTTGAFRGSAQFDRLLNLDEPLTHVEQFFHLAPPEDVLMLRQAWDAACADHPVEVDHRVVMQGDTRWFHVRAEVQRDAAGRPAQLFGTTQEITEVREAQLALEANRERLESLVAARTAEVREQTSYLRALIDNFPFLVWLKDTQGRYLTLNRATAHAFGRSVQELVGRTDADRMPVPGRQAGQSLDGEALVAGKPVMLERMFHAVDGRFWAEIYSAPVLQEDGKVLGTMGYARDVSERKALDDAREQALAEAQRLADARSAFLANMSHEIRTPLNAVLGLAQLGVRGGGSSAQTFQRILASGQHLLGVVNDILDFSKIEAGKVSLERIPFDLLERLDDVIDMIAPQIYAKGLDFIVDEAPDLPHRFVGDSLRLGQVLMNLLSNAVKFTERGRIVLAVQRAGDALVLRVADTGIGIDEAELARLFKPFEQVDSSTTRRFGGSGLGLAISRRLVELMGGRISVSSRPGEGSTFELHLPLHDHDADLPSPLPDMHADHELVGLDAEESEAVIAAIVARGGTARCVGGRQPFAAEAVVVVDQRSLQDARIAARVRHAASRGQRVGVAVMPGTRVTIDLAPAPQLRVLMRPLRLRQLNTLARAGAVPSDASAMRLRGVRILAAEDNEVNRLVLQEMLDLEGAQATVVDSGARALALLQATPDASCDVLITDIQMPGMDGYELARRVRAGFPALPILGLTAHAMPEERARCLAAGMNAHLAKPIHIDKLCDVILQWHRGGAHGGGTPSSALVSGAEAGTRAIDWNALRRRFKPVFVDKLVRSAQRSYADLPATLQAAAAAGDTDTLARLAHNIKGTSGNLEARALLDAARALEAAAREGRDDAFALARSLAALVDGVMAELAEHLAHVDDTTPARDEADASPAARAWRSGSA